MSNHKRSVSFTDSIKLKHVSDKVESKSETSSPRTSTDTTPRSRENSPRKKLLQVFHKLTHKDETPPHMHPTIYPIYDENGMELGEYHYELFDYAMNGNLRKIKEVFDSEKYTQADRLIVIKTAKKYNHPDIVYFTSSYR